MALINTTTTGVLGTTLFGDGAGELTVQKDGVTINKVTTTPTFAAYQTTGTSVTASTFTKILFQAEFFDTANCFDLTNSRFTPNVAGYYQINSNIYMTGQITRLINSIWKNGSEYVRGFDLIQSGYFANGASCLMYLNGTTDYVEAYTYNTTGGVATVGDSRCQFSGFLVKAA
jgi:hypothetical protein